MADSENLHVILYDCSYNDIKLFEKHKYLCQTISYTEEKAIENWVKYVRRWNSFTIAQEICNSVQCKSENEKVFVEINCYRLLTTIDDLLTTLNKDNNKILAEIIDSYKIWVNICSEQELLNKSINHLNNNIL